MAAHRTCQDLALLLLSAAVACHLLASSADGDSVVDASYKLNSGGLLIDDNYAYVLVMQWDCNLVLYEPRKNGGAPLWNSGTGGRGSGCYARMETDGVFAIYDSNQNRVWGTDSHQDDTNGGLTIKFKMLACKSSRAGHFQSMPACLSSVLK